MARVKGLPLGTFLKQFSTEAAGLSQKCIRPRMFKNYHFSAVSGNFRHFIARPLISCQIKMNRLGLGKGPERFISCLVIFCNQQ